MIYRRGVAASRPRHAHSIFFHPFFSPAYEYTEDACEGKRCRLVDTQSNDEI